jgi:prophage regulatory protein
MRRLIRKSEVRSVVGLSNSTIDRLEAKDMFPRRVALTPKTSCWLSDQIEAWVEKRIAASSEVAVERAPIGKQLAKARADARRPVLT